MLEILIGILAGICTGLGLGGGSVLILLLTALLGFEQHIAQATNLLCFIPSAIVSIFLNSKNKNINFKNGFPIMIFGVIGAIIGSLTSEKLSVTSLRKLFGYFLIFISIYEIYSFFNLYIKNKNRHTNNKIN